jgi:hypothetical protein
MKISLAALSWMMICAPFLGFAGQTAGGGAQAGGTNQATASKPAVAAAPDAATKPDSSAKPSQEARPRPSELLQPALEGLQQTVGALNQEKWKKGTVRSEAETNIQAIQRDLTATLPPLLKTADSSSGSMSKVLPVSRNIDALYDVLLRVVDGARISAPGDQVGQLQTALTGLEKARLSLNDRLQEMAAAGEKQVSDLQVALKAQPVPVCPVAAPPASPAAATPAVKKKAVKKKPKAAVTAPPASPQPAPISKPQQ